MANLGTPRTGTAPTPEEEALAPITRNRDVADILARDPRRVDARTVQLAQAMRELEDFVILNHGLRATHEEFREGGYIEQALEALSLLAPALAEADKMNDREHREKIQKAFAIMKDLAKIRPELKPPEVFRGKRNVVENGMDKMRTDALQILYGLGA